MTRLILIATVFMLATLPTNAQGLMRACGLRRVTFQGLRHTHISTLLREGIPITTVSKRAGHENPAITLSIYAHAMGRIDEAAANKMDEIMNKLLNSP